MSTYSIGTITLSNLSKTVVGVGTSWSSIPTGTQLYLTPGGMDITYKATIVDDTHLTIDSAYIGLSRAGLTYVLGGVSDTVLATQVGGSNALDHIEVLLGLGEGPGVGLVDGFKSFYIGDTPAQQPDGTMAFKDMSIQIYPGDASPPAITMTLGGFSNPIAVNIPLYSETPIIVSTTQEQIDVLMVRMVVSNLTKTTSDGVGSNTVEFDMEYKQSSSSTWLPFGSSMNKVISGKYSSSTIFQYRQAVPRVADTYDIRITKTSDESTLKNVKDIGWESVQQIITGPLTFPDTALAHFTAQASNQISGTPEMWGLYTGLYCHVPSNYDPVARTFAGTWDGTFKLATTDDPVWILYELITNSRWGFNRYYNCTIDKYDCYAASQWTSALVPDGQGGHQCRYTFNQVITDAISGIDLANLIAGTFNGRCFDDQNGTIILRVDMDDEAVALFTPEMVENGIFNYSYSDLDQRYNEITVTFPNPDLNYNTDRRLITNQDSIDKIGPVPVDYEMPDVNNLHEALRRGYFRLISSITEVEQVAFNTNRMGSVVEPFNVILVADPDMGYSLSGRVQTLSVDRHTVNVRDGIPLEASITYTVDFQTPAGVLSYAFTQGGAGTVHSFTFGSALDATIGPDTPFSIASAVGSAGLPKPYRVLKVVQSDGDPDKFSITAIELNRAKYAAADNATFAEDIDYSNKTISTYVVPPTGIAFDQFQTNVLGITHNTLEIGWTKTTDPSFDHYRIEYEWNGGLPQLLMTSVNDKVQFNDPAPGKYKFYVYAVNLLNYSSNPLIGNFTVSIASAPNMPFVTGLEIDGLGSQTLFDTPDVTFAWRKTSITSPLDLDDEDALNGAESAAIDSTFKDYLLQLFDVTTGKLFYQTTTVDPLFSFSYDMNYHSTGGPRRSFLFMVQYRDKAGNVSFPASITVSNPAPLKITGIQTSIGPQIGSIIWPSIAEPDVKGYRVWESTTSGFTPSDSNQVYDGPNTIFSDLLHSDSTQYLRVAAYDVFGFDLNYSDEIAMTIPVAGVPDGSITIQKFAAGLTPVEIFSVLPVTGNFVGRTVVLTTDSKLYRWNGTGWTAAVPTVDLTGTITAAQLAPSSVDLSKIAAGLTFVEIVSTLPTLANYQGRTVMLTTDNKLYRYDGTSWISSVPTVDLTGTITAAQISAGAVDVTKVAAGLTFVEIVGTLPVTGNYVGRTVMLTADNKLYRYNGSAFTAAVPVGDLSGQITAAQITAGTITTNEIASNTIVAGNIASATITGSLIAAGTLTASNILAGTITSNEIAANTITSANILAGTIVASDIASGTITGTLIAGLTITAANIAGATITGAKIAANTITASNIAANTITAGQIAAGSITSAQLTSGIINTSTLIASNVIISGHLTVGAATLRAYAAFTSGTTIPISSGVLVGTVTITPGTTAPVNVTIGLNVNNSNTSARTITVTVDNGNSYALNGTYSGSGGFGTTSITFTFNAVGSAAGPNTAWSTALTDLPFGVGAAMTYKIYLSSNATGVSVLGGLVTADQGIR